MKTYIKNISKFFRFMSVVIIFCFGFFIENTIQAQGLEIKNPIDIFYPWSSEHNPGLVSFQKSRMSLGAKVFHMGFMPGEVFGIKESHINASFPFLLPYGVGLGCDMRYYTSGIFSEINSSLMFSKKIMDHFSLGVKVGWIGVGFAREKFVVVEANDPLLSGNLWNNSLNIGLGSYFSQGNLSLGLGINHINRPNIGFKTDAKLPMEISAAIGYKLGALAPALLFQDDGIKKRYGFAMTFIYKRLGVVKFSYENEIPFKTEFQLNLGRNTSIQYSLDLPGKDMNAVSIGSHELVFNYTFGDELEIGIPQIDISTNTMKILDKTIIRSMTADLLPDEVEKINDLTSIYLDTKKRNQNLFIITAGALNKYENKLSRQERYKKYAREIKGILYQNPTLKLILRADKKSLSDARTLKQFLLNREFISSKNIKIARVNSTDEVILNGFKPGQSTTSNKERILSEKKLVFRFEVPGKTRQVKSWKFQITDDAHQVIKIYSGKDKLPHELEWYWKNDNGEIVSPGQYTGNLYLRTTKGNVKSIKSSPLEITQINRTVTFQFRGKSLLHASKINP